MEKKERITIYLPQKLYIEIFDRHLEHQFSYLVALLVEEFIRATDARIIWAEMPSKAEQRAYLERKVKELFSRNGQSAEPPNPPVQEKTEPPKPSVQEPPKEVVSPSKPEPIKEEKTPPPEEDDFNDDILKKLESFW